MAQILKESVKDRIDESALKQFADQGFLNTSMSGIAFKAGISVGNIYRYYKNKEELFYSIIPSGFLREFTSIINDKMKTADGVALDKVNEYGMMIIRDEKIREFLFNNRYRIIVIFDKCHGTRYENFKKTVIDTIVKNAVRYQQIMEKNEIILSGSVKSDMLYVIYGNFLTALIKILYLYKARKDIDEAYDLLLEYHYNGISSYLE